MHIDQQQNLHSVQRRMWRWVLRDGALFCEIESQLFRLQDLRGRDVRNAKLYCICEPHLRCVRRMCGRLSRDCSVQRIFKPAVHSVHELWRGALRAVLLHAVEQSGMCPVFAALFSRLFRAVFVHAEFEPGLCAMFTMRAWLSRDLAV